MPKLNPFAISGILIVITYLPLFFLILIKGKTKLTKIYSLHILSILLWGGLTILIATSKNENFAMLLWNISYSCCLFVSVFFLHTTLLILNRSGKIILPLAYSQAILFSTAEITLEVKTIRLVFNSFYYFEGTTFLLVSVIAWLLIFSFPHFLLIKHYKNSYPQQQKQLGLLIFGTITGLIGGVINFLSGFNSLVYPFGNFLIPFHSTILTYAILKHQLFDIAILIRRSIVYSFLIAALSILYLVTVVLLENSFQHFFGYESTILSVLTAFFLGLLFIPLRNKIQRFVDKSFFYRSHEEIEKENEDLKAKVIQAEKSRTIATFASGIAHEVKNPLTAIKVFSDYLPQRLNDQEFLKKFSRIVGKEATRINELVHSLLEFAKPSAPTLAKTNTHNLLDEILDFLNSRLIKNHIKVEKIYDKSLPNRLNVDSQLLKQAFLNLLINAIDAMPDGGKLQIETSLTSNKAYRKVFQITFTDTGPGIPKKNLPHIFDPFFTQKDGGTGLGLSITQSIVLEHNGEIGVKSKKGQGTTFAVQLPIYEF